MPWRVAKVNVFNGRLQLDYFAIRELPLNSTHVMSYSFFCSTSLPLARVLDGLD